MISKVVANNTDGKCKGAVGNEKRGKSLKEVAFWLSLKELVDFR